MTDPIMLADWPDRTAYERYKRAIRDALAERDPWRRSRLLAEATARWDAHLEREERMAA